MKEYHKNDFYVGVILMVLVLLASVTLNDKVYGQDIEVTNAYRSRINFNREWKFQLGDFAGAEKKGFDDTKWENIGLPHSFSTPYFMSPDFYVGYGWYRKCFNVPASYKNKQLFIEFEAAFQDAEVFINGKKLGGHKGGYTGFSIDISDAVVPGLNLIAVRLNNLWNPGLAPRAGEHVFSGGLYRDVYLVVTNPVHVTWYGTFVTTPIVSAKLASIHVSTEIKNSYLNDRLLHVSTEIFSPEGERVGQVSGKNHLVNGRSQIVDEDSMVIVAPQLWSPAHPSLYKAVTSVYADDVKQDEYITTFGVRSIKWTADSGFFLNKEHLYLLGVNAHQDHAGWGDAVTNAGFYRDVAMLKEAGFNFIRGSHYPHDPAFVKACDSLGMCYWSENPFWGIGGSSSTPEGYWNSSAYPTQGKDCISFEKSIKQELREMIRIHRNSPSVIAWSMSNEPFFTASSTFPAMHRLLSELVKISHEEDPTRVAAIGGAQRPIGADRIDKIGDVAGYNGDGSIIPVFQSPGIATIVSEYGSTSSDRPGKYEPGWGDLAKDKGSAIHQWRSGQAIWCGFDHGSIAGERLGKMGIVDYFRIPKRSWYWYRNVYAHKAPPVWSLPGIPAKLLLQADHSMVNTDGTDDVKLLVNVLDSTDNLVSSNPPVELKVISGPGEFPTGTKIKFEENSDIRIQDGQAAIEFRSYYAGKTVIMASSPGLQSAEITINFTGKDSYVDGVSPKISEHPYVRFVIKRYSAVVSTFGLNNPTSGSSYSHGHSSELAADGSRDTWWQASSEDPSPQWIVDTEKKLLIKSIEILFPKEDIYQFKIEISNNGKLWKPVLDFTNNEKKIRKQQVTLDGIEGGVVRISFNNAVKAKLSEVRVTGMVLD